MHEVQVQIGEAQVGQAGPARFLHILRVMFGVPQFGCYEHLLPGHSLEGGEGGVNGLMKPCLRYSLESETEDGKGKES